MPKLDKNKILVRTFWFATAVLIALQFWYIWYSLRLGSYDTIIHYDPLLGADITGSAQELYKIPLYGLVFSIVNAFLAYFSYKLTRILPHILAVTALICSVVLSVALLLILRAGS